MTEAYPLHWPDGWPRTRSACRDGYLSGYDHRNSQSWSKVTHRLLNELRLLKAEDVIISTNQPLRRDGLPYAQQRRIEDPGVAVYFRVDGRALVIAQDRFWNMPCNIRSIALAIEGLRQMQRHGGDHIMERAFTGFAALPAPKAWPEVLGFPPDATITGEALGARFRALAKEHHPDRGGDPQKFAAITEAVEEGRRALACLARA